MSAHKDTHFRTPEFVEKLKINDPESIKAVVEAYTGHIFKAGLGMGMGEQEAQEICQNTWITFFEIIKRFEGRSHVRTFIFGIFYKKCSEFKRSNAKFERHDPIDEIMEKRFLDDGHWKENPGDPHKYVEKVEVLEIVEECLEHLPLQQRAAFTLKIIEENETGEVCEILGVTHTNLRQLLFRGKNRLKTCVDGALKC